MNYKELIEHVLRNSEAYIEDYSKKDHLEDFEKGILHGLWMDIDSINNQLFIEKTDADDPKIIEEVEKLEDDLKLEERMGELTKLVNDEKLTIAKMVVVF